MDGHDIEVREYTIENIMGMANVDSAFSSDTLRRTLITLNTIDKKQESILRKVDKRRLITEEAARRRDIKRAEYERADQRHRESRNKLDRLLVSHRTNDRYKESANRGKSDCENRLGLLNDMFSDDETLKHRAAMLHAMQERNFIDTTEPIRYSLEPTCRGDEHYLGSYQQSLTWVTKRFPIVVKRIDEGGCSVGEGRDTKTLFGPFKITVRRNYNSYSGGSSADALAVKWNRDLHTIREGYAHPHVSSCEEICLGTMKAPLLEFMKVGDYAGVINAIMSVLSSYNPRDPYHKLRFWEPNRFSTPVCTSCDKALLFCDCTTDITTAAPTDIKYLSSCGASAPQCLRHHERHEEGAGINGSSCMPSRHSSRFSPEHVAGLGQDIESMDAALDKLLLNSQPE